MSRKAYLSLLLVTAAVIVVTVFVRVTSTDYRPDVAGDELAFPDFLNVVNDAAVFTIESEGKTITLELTDAKDWVIAERSGYPADGQKVREMLLAFARMNATEPKTKSADLYHRLQVNDPTNNPDAKGRRVRVADDNGEVLLEVIFGKSVSAAQGVPQGGVYYRLPDQEQSWLARGRIEPGIEVEDWLERQVIDVKRERMARVTLRHPDGDIIRIQRNADSGSLELLDVPDGYRLQSEFRRDSITGFLNELAVIDVARPDGLALSGKAISETTYVTSDGLMVVLSLSGGKEDGHWMQVKVTGERDAASEAEQLTSRLEGWLFRISDWKAGDLKRRMKDLIEADVADENAGTSYGG